MATLIVVALAAQYVHGSDRPTFRAANFFSYFTVLSNLLGRRRRRRQLRPWTIAATWLVFPLVWLPYTMWWWSARQGSYVATTGSSST
jgi:hypothetical protein